jgi:hypothetical protein
MVKMQNKTINTLASGLSDLHKRAEKRRELSGQSSGQPDVVRESRITWLATADVSAAVTKRSSAGSLDKSIYDSNAHTTTVKIECETPLLWRIKHSGERKSKSGIDVKAAATVPERSVSALFVFVGAASSYTPTQKMKAKSTCANALKKTSRCHSLR